MAHQGLLLVLSGPSGVGKGTVKSAMVKQKAFSFFSLPPFFLQGLKNPTIP